MNYPPELPILGPLIPGTKQRHRVLLPGAALSEEPRPVVTVTGANPGPTLLVGAGVHGGEYPAIEAVIRLIRALDPATLSGTLILMPVLNLPAFWNRSMFVCPVDGVNPNRVFPGDPAGSYSEQMTHAFVHEFIVRADVYLDLHGGDIPEALVPFSICRAGETETDHRSKDLALAFGLPYVLTVGRPIQRAKGSSSFVAAAEMGVPAVLAEAGGAGQLQEGAVTLLTDGVRRVMRHLRMSRDSVPEVAAPVALSAFEWVYATNPGMFYPRVAPGDFVIEGAEVGMVGSLFGDTLETVVSPVSGRVLFLTINPAVAAAGLLMGVGVGEAE
ncbi:MAG: M14 family metallopeptidase [Chthoniobacterales bacterium]